jgi:hypothetical protein
MALHFKENHEMNKINQLDDFAPRVMALYDERLQTWGRPCGIPATEVFHSQGTGQASRLRKTNYQF